MKKLFFHVQRQTLFVIAVGVIALTAVSLLVGVLLILPKGAPFASIQQQSSSDQGNEAASNRQAEPPATNNPSWKPEIPVNEYWDFGTLEGNRLYVNNTDRNVIYALNPDTGKIVWTIWSKDYGFERFQIKMIGDRLFVKGGSTDNDIERVLVFDEHGQLRWSHNFLGYVDIPQMLVGNGRVILESRTTTDDCLKGCGILCQGTKPPEAWCTTHELWAFDMSTGDVLWVNRTATLYNMNMGFQSDGNIRATGGGWGGYNHAYTIDITTGEVLTRVSTLHDRNQDSGAGLVFDQNAQTVSFTPADNQPATWKVDQHSPLYKLISEHADVNGLRLYMGSRTFLLIETKDDDSVQTYAVNAKNGNLLWSKDLDGKRFRLELFRETADALVIQMGYMSTCNYLCDTCKGSVICIDEAPPKECTNCRKKEEADPNYSPVNIWSVQRSSGGVNWKWHDGKNWLSLGTINEQGGFVLLTVFYGANERTEELDLQTGTIRVSE